MGAQRNKTVCRVIPHFLGNDFHVVVRRLTCFFDRISIHWLPRFIRSALLLYLLHLDFVARTVRIACSSTIHCFIPIYLRTRFAHRFAVGCFRRAYERTHARPRCRKSVGANHMSFGRTFRFSQFVSNIFSFGLVRLN